MEVLTFDLQFFADGGAAAGASAGAGDGANAPASDAAKQTVGDPVNAEGKQDAANAGDGAKAPEAAKKSLAELLRGDEEYKKEFDRIFDRRFAKAKAAEEKLAKYERVAPVLQQYYGTADGDVDALISAVEADDGYFKKKAVENGTSAKAEREAFRRDQETKAQIAENKRLQDEIRQRDKAIRQEALYRRWDEEIPKVREKYPDFDVRAEAANPMFAELAARFGMQVAYETVHREELDAKLVEQARREVADSVAANLARPAEGGISRNAAPPVKSDLHNYILENRQKIRDEVKRGKKITFT